MRIIEAALLWLYYRRQVPCQKMPAAQALLIARFSIERQIETAAAHRDFSRVRMLEYARDTICKLFMEHHDG